MSAAATDDYQALDGVRQTFSIAKGTPKLTFTLPAKAKVQGSSTLNATSDPKGTITYALGGGDQVCTLNQSRTEVRYHRVGVCTVIATVAATADYAAASVSQSVEIVGDLSVSAVVDPSASLPALLGYHHVTVNVDGLADPATATLTAAGSAQGIDVIAVGPNCGTLFHPARTCQVTSTTDDFDWYVNLRGADGTDLTFTVATTDGQTASTTVHVNPWPWES
jgi:hypothetical protein